MQIANPVMNSDPTGYYSTLVDAAGTLSIMGILSEMATINISLVLSIYAFLKVVDIITYVPLTIQNLLNTNEDILDGIFGIGDVAIDVRNDDTYYHETSEVNAGIILKTGILIGGKWEGGAVFAWRKQPTKKALRLSGAISAEVLIRFSTMASFISDIGIENRYVQRFEPVKSYFSLPVKIKSASIVRTY